MALTVTSGREFQSEEYGYNDRWVKVSQWNGMNTIGELRSRRSGLE